MVVRQVSIRYRVGYLVSLTSDGLIGWGEATPLSVWSRADATDTGETLNKSVERINEEGLDVVGSVVMSLLSESPYACAALAGAWADLRAQQSGCTLTDYLVDRQAAKSAVDASTSGRASESGGPYPKPESGRGWASGCASESDVGSSRAVSVNALITGSEPDEVETQVEAALKAGFDTVKLKVGSAAPDIDVLRIRAARSALGVEPELRLDANGAWDPATAVEVLSQVKPCRIAFCEDPVDVSDFGMSTVAEVGQASETAVAVDESIRSLADVETAVVLGIRTIVMKPQALGGPEQALKIAARAIGMGAGVIVTSFMDAAIGVAHALHVAAAVDVLSAADTTDSVRDSSSTVSGGSSSTVSGGSSSTANGGSSSTARGSSASSASLSTPGNNSCKAHGLATSGLIENDLADPIRVEAGFMRIPLVSGLGITPYSPHRIAEI